MALDGGAAQSETEAMAELAKQLWERYIKQKAKAELLPHSLVGYKATVEENNGDGTLTVSRPFDDAFLTLKCPSALAEIAENGDQVLIVALGDLSNAFVLCKTDMSGIGGGEVRVSELDFSELAQNVFSVTWEDAVSNQYFVTRDNNDRITSITNIEDGFTTEVIW